MPIHKMKGVRASARSILEDLSPHHISVLKNNSRTLIWHNQTLFTQRNDRWRAYEFTGQLSLLAPRHVTTVITDVGNAWCYLDNTLTYYNFDKDVLVTDTNLLLSYDRISAGGGDSVWLLQIGRRLLEQCVAPNTQIERVYKETLANSPRAMAYFENLGELLVWCYDNIGKGILVSRNPLAQHKQEDITLPAEGEVIFAPPFVCLIDRNSECIYYTTDPRTGWNRFPISPLWANLNNSDLEPYNHLDSNRVMCYAIAGRLFFVLTRKYRDSHKTACLLVHAQDHGPRLVAAWLSDYWSVVESLGDCLRITTPKGMQVLHGNGIPHDESTMIYAPVKDCFIPASAFELSALLDRRKDESPSGMASRSIARQTMPRGISWSLPEPPIIPIPFSPFKAPDILANSISTALIAHTDDHRDNVFTAFSESARRSFQISRMYSNNRMILLDAHGNLWGHIFHQSYKPWIYRVNLKTNEFFTFSAHGVDRLIAVETDRCLVKSKNRICEYRFVDGTLHKHRSVKINAALAGLTVAKLDRESDDWLGVVDDRSHRYYKILPVFSNGDTAAFFPSSNTLKLCPAAPDGWDFVCLQSERNTLAFMKNLREGVRKIPLPNLGIHLGEGFGYIRIMDAQFIVLHGITPQYEKRSFLLKVSDGDSATSDVIAAFDGPVALASAGRNHFLLLSMGGKPIVPTTDRPLLDINQNSYAIYYHPDQDCFSSLTTSRLSVPMRIPSRITKIDGLALWRDKTHEHGQ